MDGQSHVAHSEEEAAGTRLTVDSLTCLLANQVLLESDMCAGAHTHMCTNTSTRRHACIYADTHESDVET